MADFKEWLKLAYADVLTCGEIKDNSILTNMMAFHAQQAVEKSLKSLLAFHKRKIPKTHSLNNLFELCREYIDVPDEEIVNVLDELYIESRYPGDMGILPNGKPTLSEANEFYIFAKDFFSDVCKLLGVGENEIKE